MRAYILNPDPEFMTRRMTRQMADIKERAGVNQFGQFVDRLGVQSKYGLDFMLSNLTLLAGGGAAFSNMHDFGTTQYHPLGTIAVARDGRVFRYATAGASTLVAGNVIQGPVPIPNHLALTAAAQAIGTGTLAVPIVVTPGATAGAANLYAEGYLNVSVTPSLAAVHKISGHPAITASTAFNLYLDPDDLVRVAFTTSTRYGLIHNLYKNVLQTPTTNTGKIAGVAIAAITANTTANNYGWLQTRGPCSVLINGTPAVTAPVANSGTTAGAVDVWTTAAAAVAVTPVGYMMQIAVSTETNLVFLTID